jgi:chemotaxis protein methyltransferase CheR
MAIDAADFDYISRYLRAETGIVIETGKEYLVEARMTPLAQKEGFDSIASLFRELRASTPNGLHRKVVDAMTTNETLFFRDSEPFELLKTTLLPELIEKRRATRRLTVWCAASSTGQEPYSLVMLMREHFPELATWTVDIRATDICTTVIDKARAGRYGQLEVNRGLPARMLVRYFTKAGTEWELDASIRSAVTFAELNLNAPWPALPTCDIVMIRNVMIYFDVPAKRSILSRIRGLLAPDGYLFLGAAETTMGLDDAFVRVPAPCAGCYRVGDAVRLGKVS